ncbi:uncharacterized protein METZ01_LOCUS195957 [marine metagenome]|uniref:Uncharacterized protein n=1 Tax=marine metagenome TaxID=408172 RepID=A0A382DZI7_9ZZZZ
MNKKSLYTLVKDLFNVLIAGRMILAELGF